MLHCTHCDHTIPADAKFCTHCGAGLGPAAATTPFAMSAPATPLEGAVLSAPVVMPHPAPHPVGPVGSQPINVNVNVAMPITAPAAVAPVVVIAPQANSPGCLIRAVYFVFLGIWLGLFWTSIAWFLLLTVIGLPFGLLMLNRLPQVMTLKPVRRQTQVTLQGGAVVVSQGEVAQHSFWLRALYFVCIGWWFSGLWLGVAWALTGITFGLGLPLAFWMFDQTPAIVTLARR